MRRAFKRFIRDYGTHYISSAFMGSKIATVVHYDNYERLKYGKQRLFNCTAEFAAKYFMVYDEEETNNKNNKKDADDDEEDGNLNPQTPKDSINYPFCCSDKMMMEEKRCPDIDAADTDRVSIVTYGAAPG